MLEDLLKGILEGAVTQPQTRRSQSKSSSDPLQDLLGGILGGGAASQQQSAGGMDMGDLLEGVLGGGASQQRGSSSAVGGGMGDLLEAILGGGGSSQRRSSTSAGGLGGLLEAILGGGSGVGSNSFLTPVIEGLAEKLGLPPAIAQMVVGFVLNKLLSGGLGGMASSAATPSSGRRLQAEQSQGYDLDHLLEAMGSGQQVDSAYLRSSGMADELAQQTGLDARTAERSLQEVFDMLGGQVATERRQVRQPTPGSLDHLLETW